MRIREVTVNYIWQGEICTDFPDRGVFYENTGMVIRVDPYGEVAVYDAKPVEGTNVVVVEEGADDLLSDNPDLFIGLVMSGCDPGGGGFVKN